MGMKKKMLSATLCAVMVGSLVAPAFTVQAADDTLVYWSMWEATEPQGQVIQEAVDAYTEQTGVKVDLQFKGRTGNREALQPALDGGTLKQFHISQTYLLSSITKICLSRQESQKNRRHGMNSKMYARN